MNLYAPKSNIATTTWNSLQPTDSKNNGCLDKMNFVLSLGSNLTATLEQNDCQQNGIINSHTKKNQRQLHIQFDPIV